LPLPFGSAAWQASGTDDPASSIRDRSTLAGPPGPAGPMTLDPEFLLAAGAILAFWILWTTFLVIAQTGREIPIGPLRARYGQVRSRLALAYLYLILTVPLVGQLGLILIAVGWPQPVSPLNMRIVAGLETALALAWIAYLLRVLRRPIVRS
jgi:hypothetical protein